MRERFLSLPAALLFLLLLVAVSGAVAEDGVFTLWPLVDYRYSTKADFHSWKFLGPILKYERYGSRRQRAFRPFYYRSDHLDDDSYTRYILFPVAKKRSSPEEESTHVLGLYQNYKIFADGNSEKTDYQKFTLFPFIFYGQDSADDSYFAFFPFGGTIKNRLQRDEINFFLFPLYGRTERKGTSIRNILWPVYADITGENESGIKVWPFYGASEKNGVYKKRFYLWPFFFRYDLKLDTLSPETIRAFFPFYYSSSSRERSSTHVLWPFFSHIENREKGYEEWNYPWPLFRTSLGESRQGNKALPFYSDEQLGEQRKRWFLWPVYKSEEMSFDGYQRRRDRILFFLFSRTHERHFAQPWKDKKRIAFWPFFTYDSKGGVSDFYFLSLLEPFFPESEALERTWAPLWRIYQYRSDENQEIELSSLLWNLYWKERQGNDLAWELFPLVRYRRDKESKDLKLFKGLFRYRSTPDKHRLNFLFLPWGIDWKTRP